MVSTWIDDTDSGDDANMGFCDMKRNTEFIAEWTQVEILLRPISVVAQNAITQLERIRDRTASLVRNEQDVDGWLCVNGAVREIRELIKRHRRVLELLKTQAEPS